MVFSASDALEGMHAAQQQGMLMRMLSLGSGPGSADLLAGGGLSRLSAIGRPMGSAAMGMMGLDPMSLGMRAGMGAWNMGGGLMSAGMAGIGVAAGAGILGVGAQWAGGQMMTGAQQQLGLNMAMRQNFNFMNSQGGMGFTANQGFQVGDALRGMAGVAGPGGEFQTFGELSRLAANMGRMGMGQNVRTVQEFKENFKKMLDTVKTIAHDMGTSLEEAQKMMVSMKNSGIFQKADQIRLSGGMRMGGLATGLAMSEFSGAANIGSQISRSIGGLGRQGAFAGMRTMEQIGMAQRVGAINEEDIYNATGLNGAEGRQALAAAQMQQSAAFMQSGRGRRFLASIAGQNGTLNMDAVNEWMAGGNMTTGRTMELAHQNLAGMGRANFIRNEGRLRGAALEKFGGLAQSMVYKQWLGSRGFDANDMDDRAMLAFQRFSGMGRDEADLAIKQIQSLPQQMAAMQDAERTKNYGDQLAQYKKTTGIEGLKRKFDLAREHVQDKLQAAGSKILEAGSSAIEGWFNKTMDIYVSNADTNIGEISRAIDLGGGMAKAQYRRHLSTGGLTAGAAGINASMLENQKLKFAAMMGTTDPAIAKFSSENADFIKMASLSSMGAKTPQEALARFQQELAGKSSAKDILAKFSDKNATDAQKVAMMQTMQAQAGVESSALVSNQIQKQVYNFTPGGKFHSEAEFQESLGRKLAGAAEDRSEEGQWNNAKWYSKLAAGAAGGLALASGTLGYLSGESGGSGSWTDRVFNPAMQATIGMAGGIQKTVNRVTGVEDRYKGMADIFQEQVLKELAADMFVGGATGKAAQGSILDRIASMRSKEKLSDREKGTLEGLSALSVGGMDEYQKDLEEYDANIASGKSATGAATARQAEMAARFYKNQGKDVSLDLSTEEGAKNINEAMKAISAMRGEGKNALYLKNMENLNADNQRIMSMIASDRDMAKATGYMTVDEKGNLVLSAKAKAERSKLSPAAQAAAAIGDQLVGFDPTKPSKAAVDKYLKENNISPEEYQKGRATYDALIGNQEYHELAGAGNQAIGALDIKTKREMARGGGPSAKDAAYQVQVEEKFVSASKKTGGSSGALAKMFGVDLTKEQVQALEGNKDKGAVVRAILSKANINDQDLQGALTAALNKDTVGGKAAGIDAAMQNMKLADKQKLQDAKASSDDPVARATLDMRDAAKKHTQLLEALVRSNDASAKALQDIKLEDKNAENKK